MRLQLDSTHTFCQPTAACTVLLWSQSKLWELDLASCATIFCLQVWLSVISKYYWCWAQKPTTNTEEFGHYPLYTPSNHPALPVKHYVQVQLNSIGFNSHISVDHQRLAACHYNHRPTLRTDSTIMCYWILIHWLTYSWCWAQKPVTRSENLESNSEQVEQSDNTFERASLETWST